MRAALLLSLLAAPALAFAACGYSDDGSCEDTLTCPPAADASLDGAGPLGSDSATPVAEASAEAATPEDGGNPPPEAAPPDDGPSSFDSDAGEDATIADAGHPEDASHPADAAKDAPGVDSSSPIISDGGCGESPTPDTGVFVAPVSLGGSASSTTCSISSPCTTIAKALSVAGGLKTIYLAPGTYSESVSITSSITLLGGWSVSSGTWTRLCDGSTDASALDLAVIQAPSSANETVVVTNTAGVTLQTLTVSSKATAGAGESLYGIVASGTSSSKTQLTLIDVKIQVAAGGNGTAGIKGTDATQPTGTCSSASTGDNATTPGATGTALAGSYAASGFAPGNGETGSTGNPGANGTAGSFTCVTGCANPSGACLLNSADMTCNPASTESSCGTAGQPGCGGPGGSGGGGGGGGGASIGVFISNYATVYLTNGSVQTGVGGTGALGATYGSGVSGSAGSNGSAGAVCDQCAAYDGSKTNPCSDPKTTKPGGTATGAGDGGASTHGGAGADGAGGDSWTLYAYGTGGGFVPTLGAEPTLVPGDAGVSQGSGPPGNAGAKGP